MDFTSLKFLFIFLPIFFAIYFLSRGYNLKIALLLIFNLIFIFGGEDALSTLGWLGVLLIITYWAGYLIEKNNSHTPDVKYYSRAGIAGIVCILIAFKIYAGGIGDGSVDAFVCESEANVIFCKEGGLIIPLGISFLSFQAISYLVDVSKKQVPHERNIVKFLTWGLFFPKLASGPITSYKNIRDSLFRLSPNANDAADGFRLIFFGVIKRLLIANQVGLVADAVFGMPINGITPLYAWMGLLAYTIQIYFDFSGYTDIALGLGKIIGVRLPENFNYPYIADSITEFWRRWHISLSTWFREYIFFPLERSPSKFLNRQVNVLIVFILTGLWHGVTLNFLIWGLLHGLAIIIEIRFGKFFQTQIPKILRHWYTLAIIMTGWVFFRSPSLDFAIGFLLKLFGYSSNLTPLAFSVTKPLPFIEPVFLLALTAGITFSMPVYPAITKFMKKIPAKSEGRIIFMRTIQDSALLIFFALAIAAQIAGSFAPNIYSSF